MAHHPTSLTHMAPEEAADYANLRYVNASEPGITRRKHGTGFAYYTPDGEHITDDAVVERINSLAIPPAYVDVWICTDPNGHLQAKGYSETAETWQYIYHPRWRQVRDETKFNQMILFGEALPQLRQRVEKDLKDEGPSRKKVLAAVVRLLDTSLIRVGNSEYAKENDSYGLTTLRKKHTQTGTDTARFEFESKSGKEWTVEITDPRLVEVIQLCEDIPGYELFKYIDENGDKHDVTSTEVNDYLKEITGQAITAKYFRTWSATVGAVEVLKRFQQARSEDEARSHISDAVKQVSRTLRNTPAVCRKAYIHPHIIDAYLSGEFDAEIEADDEKHLSRLEKITLVLLKRRFAEAQK